MQVFSLLKKTFSDWSEDKAPRLGAALSYYTIFSIAPLIVLAIAIAGFFLGAEAVQGQLHETFKGMIGESGAKALEDMVAGASRKDEGTIATIFGVVMLLFGASGVFGELQSSLNTIWEVEPKPNRGIFGIIRDRFFSITMVLGTAFLLLVSLLISAGLSAVGKYFGEALPGGEIVWSIINGVVSFGVTTILFALIFKYVPDAKIAWNDVWIGALVTAGLFVLGKTLIGMYLGRSAVSSTYGAAGSLAIVLLWIYYVSQIFFFGAEFTQVYANTYGSRVLPDENAVPVTEDQREEAGIPHRDESGLPVRTARAVSQRRKDQTAEAPPPERPRRDMPQQ